MIHALMLGLFSKVVAKPDPSPAQRKKTKENIRNIVNSSSTTQRNEAQPLKRGGQTPPGSGRNDLVLVRTNSTSSLITQYTSTSADACPADIISDSKQMR